MINSLKETVQELCRDVQIAYNDPNPTHQTKAICQIAKVVFFTLGALAVINIAYGTLTCLTVVGAAYGLSLIIKGLFLVVIAQTGYQLTQNFLEEEFPLEAAAQRTQQSNFLSGGTSLVNNARRFADRELHPNKFMSHDFFRGTLFGGRGLERGLNQLLMGE